LAKRANETGQVHLLKDTDHLQPSEDSRSSDVAPYYSIGIGVTPEELFGALVDLNGEIIQVRGGSPDLVINRRARMRRRFEGRGVDPVVSNIAKLVADLRALRPDLNRPQLLGVGVSIGGHVNGQTGELILSPQLDLTPPKPPIPLAERLRDATGFEIVVVENDVNALAVGALVFDEVAGSVSSFAVVRLARGVGVGLVLDNELYRGATGLAGEFGHFPVEKSGEDCACGKHGCLETIAGGDAIVKAIPKRGGPKAASIEQATDLVRGGNEVARAAFEQAGEALGRGLAGLVNLLNLRLIILCGQPALLDCQPYIEQARRSFSDRAFSTAATDCRLQVERRTGELEARGAASMVFEHLRDVLDRQPE
jgi:predicted NBD/HSP70 family sugar kinase